MKRTIATILMGFIANTASFALEIHHGKILKNKTWSEGSLRVSFEDNFSKSHHAILKPHFLSETPLKDGILIRNDVLNNQGKINTPINAIGFSEIYIENFDTQARNYTVDERFCVGMNCAHHEMAIQLDPNGYISLNHRVSAAYESGTPGDYPADLYTTIINETTQSAVASYAKGTLQVDNADPVQSHN